MFKKIFASFLVCCLLFSGCSTEKKDNELYVVENHFNLNKEDLLEIFTSKLGDHLVVSEYQEVAENQYGLKLDHDVLLSVKVDDNGYVVSITAGVINYKQESGNVVIVNDQAATEIGYFLSIFPELTNFKKSDINEIIEDYEQPLSEDIAYGEKTIDDIEIKLMSGFDDSGLENLYASIVPAE